MFSPLVGIFQPSSESGNSTNAGFIKKTSGLANLRNSEVVTEKCRKTENSRMMLVIPHLGMSHELLTGYPE